LPPRHDRDNSLRRWANLQEFFAGDRGHASRDDATLRRAITTHGEGGICQHGPDMFTSLGIVIAPRERSLSTADGPPCSAPFVERTLTPALASPASPAWPAPAAEQSLSTAAP
ncbi:MAG TPA: hypothetical protein VFX49_08505, partial [Chloroflexota bacterium]|nr:hypothetical protein [Chloroflexota bacterium]